MKYDLVRDLVVIKHPNGYSTFSLFSPRVSYFVLGGSTFIYINEAENKSAPQPGFYQLLSKGSMTFLAKRSMRIEENIVRVSVERKFVSADQYYLLKEGKYNNLKNEAALLNLVGDQKQTVKQVLRKKKIRFKKNPEQAIIAVAEYINQ